MFINIDFDDQLAVASISLEGWAQPLVELLSQYFTIHKDMLSLDYSHLSTEDRTLRDYNWLCWLTDREHFMSEFRDASQHGQIALTLKILGHGSTGIENSSSILDPNSYQHAQDTFRDSLLKVDPPSLREIIVAEIKPHAIWVNWLFDIRSYYQSFFFGRSAGHGGIGRQYVRGRLHLCTSTSRPSSSGE